MELDLLVNYIIFTSVLLIDRVVVERGIFMYLQLAMVVISLILVVLMALYKIYTLLPSVLTLKMVLLPIMMKDVLLS